MKDMHHIRMITGTVCAAIILLFFSISGGYAEIYSWKDAKGVRHFGDSPVLDSEAEDQISFKEIRGVNSSPSQVQTKSSRTRQPNGALPLKKSCYRKRSRHIYYYTPPEPDSLFAAAAAGELESVKSHLSNNPSGVSDVDASGETALHHAAGGSIRTLVRSSFNGIISSKIEKQLNKELKETLPVIEYLVQKGADINKASKCGNTPLHIAVFMKQYAITRQLLKLGADPNIVNQPCPNAMMTSGTPLHVALQNSALPFIKKNLANLLLEHGAEPYIQDEDGSTPLHFAVGNVKLINEMLSKGAKADALNRLNESVLLFAASSGMRDVCERLIQAGADIHTADVWGTTPLHQAAQSGRMEVVELLIQKGADPGALNTKGQTPFFLATRWGGRKEMVELLKKYNKPIPKLSVSINEVMSLMRDLKKKYKQAILPKELEQFTSLLDDNPELINQKDGHGYTLLHEAQDNKILVKALLERGADVQALNKQRQIPLHYCYINKECAALLIKHGSRVNAVDNRGRTPLHYAADHYGGESVECVRLLLENGADPNIRDEKGKTPLQVVSAELEKEKLLKEYGAE